MTGFLVRVRPGPCALAILRNFTTRKKKGRAAYFDTFDIWHCSGLRSNWLRSGVRLRGSKAMHTNHGWPSATPESAE